MKKKILVTASTFPRFKEDSEPRFVLDLCQVLAKKFDITILVPADPASKLIEYYGDIKIVRYRYAPLRRWELLAYPGAIIPRLKQNILYWLLVPLLFLGLLFAVRKELKHNDYAAVHSHWLLPQGIIQALLSYSKKSPPFLVTSHGGDIHTFGQGVFLRIFQWVVKRSAGLTVVSKQIQKKCLKNSRLIARTYQSFQWGRILMHLIQNIVMNSGLKHII